MSIELNQTNLHAYFGAVFTTPILLVHTEQTVEVKKLAVAESERYFRITAENRRQDYLQGRAALKEILIQLKRSDDTECIVWPDAQCSLSHCDGHAIAVARIEGEGIGVDIQLNKSPAYAMAERILSTDSLSFLHALPEFEKTSALQRFWTMNEAIYKASPMPQPANFRQYQFSSLDGLHTRAWIEQTDLCFEVYCAEVQTGFVSIALRV